ncbi:Pls/PosA family non-ribosomal peptide synthetase [Streptomyces tropicalis]|uniref:Amino acid adenylation domain-containing protein n=1 Tax=Streptomyces tropicalis TaxID=3034234 RepID=A0ABT6A324_9ACTN|nr:Pls/PosA family non-ribosomal peptide synthetase [Streptomyces tropicalis]MDF3298848.1 amino acid adenylation domain-containing protein [Streptomyces tropicalis]
MSSPTLDASFPPRIPSGGRALYRSEPAAPPRTLVDVLEATASLHPDAPALDTGGEVLSYRELRARVLDRAGRLAERGVGAGDRVGVRVPSGTADLYLSILAVLHCGAAYVPVDADDPEERAATVFREAGVCRVLGPHPQPEGLLPPSGTPGERRAPAPGDDAWIIFTSGSTGAPKGVAVTHRSAAAFADAEAGLFLRGRPLGPGDRVLAGLSVAFDASCEEMWLAWRSGACLVPAERSLVRAGHELGAWLDARDITVVSTVPTLLAMWPEDALRRVRLLILGGEACPPGLVERFAGPGREMWNTYGPTEATVVACAALLEPRREVRIGLPLAGWDLAVVDEAGEPVAYGQEGELVIAGAGSARYLDTAKDAERFRPCPALDSPRAYRSGDLVRADAEGLVFLGRVDDQVKIGGRRVELGEIDAALLALPGVRGAAAAVRTTTAGAQVLVGYVVPEQAPDGRSAFEAAKARATLGEWLPAPLVPLLAEVADLPTRASGKVDRTALPWPVALAGADDRAGDPAHRLHGTAARLADVWEQLLGLRPGPDSDFVALGGTSLTAARMASVLREDFPGLSVADLYRHSVLHRMAAHLDSLAGPAEEARPARPVPRRTSVVQFLVSLAGYGLTGLRGLVGLAAADDVLGRIAPHAWAPHTAWWLVLTGWVVLFSAPMRCLLGAALARALAGSITPGAHPRGGRVHLRLWTAERAVAAFGVPSLLGTPWAARYARLLGCRTGRDVRLHTMPPVTGLAELGDGCSVEPEADIAGWWLDGDTLHIGPVAVGAGARVGHRGTLLPGAVLGRGAELAAGGCLDARVPDGRMWTGSPARPAEHGARDAGTGWPAPPQDRRRRWHLAYALSLAGLPLLSLLAAAPALCGTWLLVRGTPTLSGAALRLLAAAPVFAVLTTACGMLLTVLAVRLLNRSLTPGLHRADGGVAWRAWLVTRLLDGARGSLFPLYASLATPHWLRLLGARVGRGAEISTVLPLPSLLQVDDGAFLADDTLVAPFELRGGWMRLGPVRIGTRAFVGNSGIVGPGRDVADHALVGVLSDAPAHGEPGSSWIGRPAMPLPRKPGAADPARTFAPPRRLVVARAAVELCRLLPVIAGTLLAECVLLAEQEALDLGGLPLAALLGAPLLLAASLVACLITTGAKWLLVGRFQPGERPLWSSFVWRNELFDTFVEVLAVPWGAGAHLGTPALNWWLRSLGARIGRGVWCETYWLPETDLISLGDGVSVNRGCVLQTHLFHDRIMRMDTVHLAAGASLGPHSIALPGTTIGTGASIAASSLVMRGETVPDGTRWAGNPIAGVPATGAAAPPVEEAA